MRVDQIGGHVVVVDVGPISQCGRLGRVQEVGADEGADSGGRGELVPELGADDAVAGCDVEDVEGTDDRVVVVVGGGFRGGEMLPQELDEDSRGIAGEEVVDNVPVEGFLGFYTLEGPGMMETYS